MSTTTIQSLKEQLLQAAQVLFQAGVMSHSGHGNMSARLPEGERMLLMGTGGARMPTIEQIVTVTFDGEVIEGTLDPATREIVAMHAGAYRARNGVGSVMHTHSPQVTSFALAHKPLPCVYEAFLRFGIMEDIPVADWAPRGSRESVTNIIDQMTKHPTVPAVLLGNHGLLAFSHNPQMTAQLIVIMEEAAELTLAAEALGGPKAFPADALERERKHMQQFGSTR
jgi:L-ribulose-5-phosphate 4-epimerase